VLETWTFVFFSGKRVEYALGQCLRCHTMYWDNV